MKNIDLTEKFYRGSAETEQHVFGLRRKKSVKMGGDTGGNPSIGGGSA
ncbi:MAG: hypothetical protein IJS01_07540 [Lentisphaeria bacterium]|nr:hypothetical protein [Lentisphaeria bacterium]